MKRFLQIIITVNAFVFYTNVSATGQKIIKQGGNGSTEKQVFVLSPSTTESDYLHNIIIFKMKPEFRAKARNSGLADDRFQQVLMELNVQKTEKIFPNHQTPAERKSTTGYEAVDLSLIYRIKYNTGENIESAINKLLALGIFEYVEPSYVYHSAGNEVQYRPNDPDTASQWYLRKIMAYDAWGLGSTARGDTNVVIAIIDTGSDLDHPDLAKNIKRNYADPVNGLDDDNDGYIDNYQGWDFAGADMNTLVGDNDPNIKPGGSAHGSHVSGCASSATDNNIGVAGVGFKSKLLIVKVVADNSSVFSKGLEGIVYAADHKASIISCSWVSGSFGQYGQDIVNYAISKGALIVAGAGNSGNEKPLFPASYNGVLSVAATNASDVKPSWSNYSYNVGVCAPGDNIYQTIYNNTYASLSGTSMATPIVSGAAAIVKSYFPTYTMEQVAARLKATTDNIYPGNNPAFAGKMGTGRINLYKALSQTNVKYAEMVNQRMDDKNDLVFMTGDTIRISGDFKNFLDPLANGIATLTFNGSPPAYASIYKNTCNLGALSTLGIKNTDSDPFLLIVKPGAPVNAPVNLKITLDDGTTISTKYLTVTVNVDYINIFANDVPNTATSKGKIGWNNFTQKIGIGFSYKDSSLLYEAGLMVGVSSTQVSTALRTIGTSYDRDYLTILPVRQITPPRVAEFDAYTQFNDDSAKTRKLNLLIDENTYAWSTPGDRKYIIKEYKIRNKGTKNYNSLYAGIFADWDISFGGGNDKGKKDGALKLGYQYSTKANGFYAGVKLLTNNAPFVHYAIDNTVSGNGGVKLNDADGYSQSDKFLTLSTNRDTNVAGITGDEMITVVSTGPLTLNAGDSLVVAFAMLAGDNLADIKVSAANAQKKYNTIPTQVEIKDSRYIQNTSLNVYPNPARSRIRAEFSLSETSPVSMEIHSLLGEVIQVIDLGACPNGNNKREIDIENYKSGVYFILLKTNEATISQKIIVY